MASSWIHAVSSEPRCSKGVFGKLSRGKIFAKHRRHAAFQEQDGKAKNRQKSWQVPGFTLFHRNLVVRRACLENFLAGKFLQSIGATQRFKSKTGKRKQAKIMASSWIHAVSSQPRCSKGVFRKLSRGKIFAKQRRHAAFQEQDGEAKTSKNHGKFLDLRRSRGVGRENAKYQEKGLK